MNSFSSHIVACFRAIAICCSFSAVSLIAQDSLPPARPQRPTSTFMAFRRELNAQTMSAEQRVSTSDEWRRNNETPLANRHLERDSSALIAMATGLHARQKQAALSVPATADERELAELQSDVAAAVQEMRTYTTPPERRVQMFDEFFQANREAFQQIDVLRKMIAARRMENALLRERIQLPPRSEAEAILEKRRSIILQEIAAKRNASDQLPPQERIAAMDRDRAYFNERASALRQIGRQFQALARGQANPNNPNPR